MKKIYFYFFCGLIVLSSLTAEARFNIRLGQSFNTSNGLWVGKEKRDFSGSDLVGNENQATRHYFQTDLNIQKTLQNQIFFSLGATYSYSKTLDAPILQSVEGESHSQLTRITGRAGYHFKFNDFQISPFLGYEHPGQMSIKQPVFLSPHDYSTNFLSGFTIVNNYQKFVTSFYFANRHVIKGTQPEQMIFQIQSLYRLNQKISFGLGFDIFHAQGGIDIASDRFNAISQDIGFLPVWRKKERYKGWSFITNYRLSRLFSVDAFFHGKITGRNTDNGKTIGVAGSWDF